MRAFVNEGDFVKKGEPLIKFAEFKTVRAPFNGTVTSFDFENGQFVFPTDTVLILADLKNRYIEVSLEQEGALRVRPGQKTRVLFESLRGIVYHGKVKTIYPKADEFLIQIEVPELKENILPGMTADATIEVRKHKNALLIPLASLSNGLAMAKRKGKKLKIAVKIGGIDGRWAQALEGDIKEGDLFYAGKGEEK